MEKNMDHEMEEIHVLHTGALRAGRSMGLCLNPFF